MKQFKLIPLAVLASIGLSSCSDLLEKDSEDTLTVEQYLTSDANLLSFTYHLYGPYTWNSYESKFSWCANELTVGNVYHNYSDEGAFFFLSFDNTNAHLLNGFEGLYGVISRCNMIINDLDQQCSSAVSETARNRAKGEAYLMRGYCYFLLTEYWGDAYIITNSSKTISADKAFDVPKCSRAMVYAQAEKDYNEAVKLLPDAAWGNNGERPSKAAAYGMLGKLYLTMGAAATPTSDAKFKFSTSKTSAEYYNLAVSNIDLALSTSNEPWTEKDSYENIFWPKSYNQENIFALYFEQGPYGAGSSRQVNFARSKYLDGGDDYYGGEKGLTVTLFKSFDETDIRKKACCYYTTIDKDGTPSADKPTEGRNPVYTMYEDADYAYYYNPSKTFEASPYGSEPLSPCLNACRKFVYGVHLNNKFSAPLTFPILRTADLYLMKAEALMAIDDNDVYAETTKQAVLDLVNKVRNRAGLTGSKDIKSIALFKKVDSKDYTFTYNGVKYSYSGYKYEDKDSYCLFQERRHEFALECQNWLDLKRIYYRNSAAAMQFLRQQDRGWTYGVKLGTTTAKGLDDLQRNKEINMADATQPAEKDINISNVQWFFPIPSAVASSAGSNTRDDVSAITNGTYEY